MKHVKWIFCAVLLMAAGKLAAQDEDGRFEGTGLQAYLEFCLWQREAMLKKSADQLRECIEESTESDFRFNDVHIRLADMNGYNFENTDPTMRNKVTMWFTPDYVDELLMHDTDYRDAELEGPALMREVMEPNCCYAHKALDAGQEATYRLHCYGPTRLICVPSPDGLIAVTVRSEGEVEEPFELKDEATDDNPYTDFFWERDGELYVLVTVRNLSQKAVTFVMATD